MVDNVWPVTFDGQLYNKPVINGSKCTVNDKDFIQTVMECPSLFKHIIDNQQQIESSLLNYVDKISEQFIPNIPIGTLGRLKVAETEWQDIEKHRYVKLELIHCANYNNRLLNFHDEESQYGFFFIDMAKSISNQKLELYFDREQKPENDEEHIWANYDSIEPIYIPKDGDDHKDEEIGFLKLLNKFLLREHNEKSDELIELGNETYIILFGRLRAKIRVEKQGQIKSVQGIIQESLWEYSEEQLEDIVPPDDDYSTNSNITSYKLTRNQLFKKYDINPIFLIKVFDEFGKEMKLKRNIKDCDLFIESESYTQSVKTLILKIAKKYAKSKRVVQSMHGFNGLRISYNTSTRALIFKTNNFKSSVTVDIKKNQVEMFNTSGRNGGW